MSKKIFSGGSNKPLATIIAKSLGLDLGGIETVTFSDNEDRVRVLDNVLDQDCIVVQSTAITPNKYYMQLFFILDSLKRSGAKSITLVIPYLGYQRQDHIFRSGEAVSLDVVISILKTLGTNKVISLDFHTPKIEELFKTQGIEVSALSALELFADRIKEMRLSDFTLISPDMGGISRIKKISNLLGGIPFATIVKNRDLATGRVDSVDLQGEVSKTAVIVDDVISSGETLLEAVKLLKKRGVEEIYVFATHGIFAKDANTKLEESEIEKVVVTDTINIPQERRFKKLEIISVAKLIEKAL